MRVYFDGVNFESRTGPNSFALRLARQFSLMGHVIADPDDYDVALVFVEATPLLDRHRPYVHRLDGFWMKPTDFSAGRNRGIAETYASAAAVVCQSQFDREMALKWLGDPSRARSCVVIPNGVPIQSRAAAASGIGAQLKREHDEIFVCSANWHPQKRLADNIELFRHVRKDPRGSCLIVLGNHPDVLVRAKQDDRVFYGGSLSHQDSLALYAIADWMIHLAWLDHCPNTVVEALSVGTPVVCTGAGGTIELLQDHTGEIARGASIAERQHDLSLADYDSPPCIGTLIESFGNLRSPPAFSTAEFDIAVCAQKYADLLAEVL